MTKSITLLHIRAQGNKIETRIIPKWDLLWVSHCYKHFQCKDTRLAEKKDRTISMFPLCPISITTTWSCRHLFLSRQSTIKMLGVAWQLGSLWIILTLVFSVCDVHVYNIKQGSSTVTGYCKLNNNPMNTMTHFNNSIHVLYRITPTNTTTLRPISIMYHMYCIVQCICNINEVWTLLCYNSACFVLPMNTTTHEYRIQQLGVFMGLLYSWGNTN